MGNGNAGMGWELGTRSRSPLLTNLNYWRN